MKIGDGWMGDGSPEVFLSSFFFFPPDTRER